MCIFVSSLKYWNCRAICAPILSQKGQRLSHDPSRKIADSPAVWHQNELFGSGKQVGIRAFPEWHSLLSDATESSTPSGDSQALRDATITHSVVTPCATWPHILAASSLLQCSRNRHIRHGNARKSPVFNDAWAWVGWPCRTITQGVADQGRTISNVIPTGLDGQAALPLDSMIVDMAARIQGRGMAAKRFRICGERNVLHDPE